MSFRLGMGDTNGLSSFGRVREVSADHSFVLTGLILPDAKGISGAEWALHSKVCRCEGMRNEWRSSSVACVLIASLDQDEVILPTVATDPKVTNSEQ